VWRLSLLIVLLCVGIGVGPTLLDGCLVECQARAAQQDAPAHCHDHLTPSDSSGVRALAGCTHDHEATWADARESRVGLSQRIPLALAPRLPELQTAQSPMCGLDDTPPSAHASPPSAFVVPLRL
jgi:hypothetical protein